MILLTRSPTFASVPGLSQRPVVRDDVGVGERQLDRLAGAYLEAAGSERQVLAGRRWISPALPGSTCARDWAPWLSLKAAMSARIGWAAIVLDVGR